MALFWRKGYEGASLQDLLSATGLSKSSLYQTFGNKHALFELSMERYRHDMVTEMCETLAQAESGRAFIEQMFAEVASDTRGLNARRGCLVMNTASEFALSDPVIAKLVKQATKSFTEVFEAAVLRGQEEGDISVQKSARQLAKYLLSSISGVKTMVKAGGSANEVKAIAQITLSALD